MSTESKIEWTETSWNPITGCSKISDGCLNCYAERIAKRLHSMKNPKYKNIFSVTIHPNLFKQPLNWKRPKLVFVNSMSDLFHEEVDFNYIHEIFNVMHKASHHTFQILTKRTKRLKDLAPFLPWPSNIWIGVTVEKKEYLYRIEHLREVEAKIRFVSFEPLLGEILGLKLEGIHWVIAGGESGPNARPMHPSWVREIKHQCQKQEVPFFFKQWGGIQKGKNGRTLDNKIWNEYPIEKFDL